MTERVPRLEHHSYISAGGHAFQAAADCGFSRATAGRATDGVNERLAMQFEPCIVGRRPFFTTRCCQWPTIRGCPLRPLATKIADGLRTLSEDHVNQLRCFRQLRHRRH